MELVKLNCRNCGDVVDPRRVELGYDYCLKDECQRRCVQRVELASLGVNKAADYYTTAEEVRPPRPPAVASIDGDEQSEPTRETRERPSVNAPRPESTLVRLRRLERELDEARHRSYQRFQHGEITAREMEGECDALVDAFNRQVRAENIRYRSLLRTRRQR